MKYIKRVGCAEQVSVKLKIHTAHLNFPIRGSGVQVTTVHAIALFVAAIPRLLRARGPAEEDAGRQR
jgi:hypothetical protein